MSNTIPPSPPGGLNDRLLAIAQQLIARNDWQLMDAADLVGHAQAESDLDQQSDKQIERVLKRIYSQALYVACRGIEGSDRQWRGFDELSRYLHCVAKGYCSDAGDAVDDLVQTALQDIWAHIGEVRNPQSFLIWAFWWLRNAITEWRRRDRNDSSLDQLIGGTDTSLIELIPNPEGNPLERLLAREGYDGLWQRVEELGRQHRRAAVQFQAVLLTYRDGLEVEEIAARLGVSVPQVYVLRSRGLKKLRDHFRGENARS
ncbi:MAG TPA: sigma-70 family RNA polymerase sigma factor [Roseiflexaceae bacterium]|nr:sigma-70 family RNA polymerase sigma factor [Roseiflexaceae bacterium]